jgi:hypothetical protein
MYQNPLFKFIIGKKVYFDRNDIVYKIEDNNMALNPEHIIKVLSTNNGIRLDSGEKVYFVVLTDDNFHFISDQMDVYFSKL